MSDWPCVTDINLLPEYSGIYLLYNEGILKYIGESKNIKKRVKQHRYNARFDFDEILFTDEDNQMDKKFYRLLVETDYIMRFHPMYNLENRSYLMCKRFIESR